MDTSKINTKQDILNAIAAGKLNSRDLDALAQRGLVKFWASSWTRRYIPRNKTPRPVWQCNPRGIRRGKIAHYAPSWKSSTYSLVLYFDITCE